MNRLARSAAVLLAVPILGMITIDIDQARAQLDIAIGDLTKDECARMCSGLVNPTACRHAYYVGATRTCHLTDQDEQQLNFRPGLEIWSLNRHRWLTPGDVTSAGGFEDGVDRPGSDIKPGFDVASASDCRAACASTPGCKSFTYVHPGIQAASARCWLKHSIPPSRDNACCISGVMAAGPAGGSAPAPGSASVVGSATAQSGLHPCIDPKAVVSRRIDICGFSGCATYAEKSNFVCKAGGYFLIDSLNVVPVKCNADYSDCSPEDYVLEGQSSKVDSRGRTWIEGYERNTKTGQAGSQFSFSEVP
jgi:hypothetical protein